MKGKKSFRRLKKYSKKSRTFKKGGYNFFGSRNPSNLQNNKSAVQSDNIQPKKEEWYHKIHPRVSETINNYNKGAEKITGMAKTAQKSVNVPLTLSVLTSKINALLVHNKVNYTFSDGTNAQNYSLQNAPGSVSNDGRGTKIR